jgi:hypothetical protein
VRLGTTGDKFEITWEDGQNALFRKLGQAIEEKLNTMVEMCTSTAKDAQATC